MKNFKRILSSVLCVSMLLTASMCSFAENTETTKPTVNEYGDVTILDVNFDNFEEGKIGGGNNETIFSASDNQIGSFTIGSYCNDVYVKKFGNTDNKALYMENSPYAHFIATKSVSTGKAVLTYDMYTELEGGYFERNHWPTIKNGDTEVKQIMSYYASDNGKEWLNFGDNVEASFEVKPNSLNQVKMVFDLDNKLIDVYANGTLINKNISVDNIALDRILFAMPNENIEQNGVKRKSWLDNIKLVKLAPTSVMGTSVENGAANVNVETAAIDVDFNTPLTDASFTADNFVVTANEAAVSDYTVVPSEDKTKATVKFSKPLEFSTAYTVTVKNTIVSSERNAMTEDYTFSFTTESPRDLTILDINFDNFEEGKIGGGNNETVFSASDNQIGSFTIGSYCNDVYVKKFGNTDNKALYMENSPYVHFIATESVSTGKAVLTYDMYTELEGGYFERDNWPTIKNGDTEIKRIKGYYASDNGKEWLNFGDNVEASFDVKANSLNQVKMVFDLDNKLMDVYANGTLINKNISVDNIALDRIFFAMPNQSIETYGVKRKSWLDNIKLVELHDNSVLGTNIANGAENVSVSSSVDFSFASEITEENFAQYFEMKEGENVLESSKYAVTLSEDKKTVSVKTNDTMKFGASYTVTANAGLSGLKQAYSISFTTEQPEAFKIVSSEIADGEQNAALQKWFHFKLNASLNLDYFTVRNANESVITDAGKDYVIVKQGERQLNKDEYDTLAFPNENGKMQVYINSPKAGASYTVIVKSDIAVLPSDGSVVNGEAVLNYTYILTPVTYEKNGNTVTFAVSGIKDGRTTWQDGYNLIIGVYDVNKLVNVYMFTEQSSDKSVSYTDGQAVKAMLTRGLEFMNPYMEAVTVE